MRSWLIASGRSAKTFSPLLRQRDGDGVAIETDGRDEFRVAEMP